MASTSAFQAESEGSSPLFCSIWGYVGIGRRIGLKIRWWKHRASSSLATPTKAIRKVDVLFSVMWLNKDTRETDLSRSKSMVDGNIWDVVAGSSNLLFSTRGLCRPGKTAVVVMWSYAMIHIIYCSVDKSERSRIQRVIITAMNVVFKADARMWEWIPKSSAKSTDNYFQTD